MAVFSGNGAVGSPSFTFSSDTNTGIYRPDADQLAIVANGAQQALFTTTSNTLNGTLFNNGVIYYNGGDRNNGGFYGIDEGSWVTNNTEFQLIRTRNGAGIWGRKGASNNQGGLVFKTHTTIATPLTRGGFTEGGSFVVGGTFPSAPSLTINSGGSISGVDFLNGKEYTFTPDGNWQTIFSSVFTNVAYMLSAFVGKPGFHGRTVAFAAMSFGNGAVNTLLQTTHNNQSSAIISFRWDPVSINGAQNLQVKTAGDLGTVDNSTVRVIRM